MQPGQVLEVIADDEGIKQDMPAWCESTGNEYLGEEEHGTEIRVYIRRQSQVKSLELRFRTARNETDLS